MIQSKTYKVDLDWSVKIKIKNDVWHLNITVGKNVLKYNYIIPIEEYPQTEIKGLSNAGYKRLCWMEKLLLPDDVATPFITRIAEAVIRAINEIKGE